MILSQSENQSILIHDIKKHLQSIKLLNEKQCASRCIVADSGRELHSAFHYRRFLRFLLSQKIPKAVVYKHLFYQNRILPNTKK